MDLAPIPFIVGFSGLFLILYSFWVIKKDSAGEQIKRNRCTQRHKDCNCKLVVDGGSFYA